MFYLLCFDDMKTQENGIRKKSLMKTGITRDGVVLLYSGGDEYKENKSGEVVRIKKLKLSQPLARSHVPENNPSLYQPGTAPPLKIFSAAAATSGD